MPTQGGEPDSQTPGVLAGLWRAHRRRELCQEFASVRRAMEMNPSDTGRPAGCTPVQPTVRWVTGVGTNLG